MLKRVWCAVFLSGNSCREEPALLSLLGDFPSDCCCTNTTDGGWSALESFEARNQGIEWEVQKWITDTFLSKRLST
jgi:hypothetical protein